MKICRGRLGKWTFSNIRITRFVTFAMYNIDH